MPVALGIAAAVVLAFSVVANYAEFAADVAGLDTRLLLFGLGPALVCLAAALAGGLRPRLREVAGRALLAVGAPSGWSAAWTLATPGASGWPVATITGAVLALLAGAAFLAGRMIGSSPPAAAGTQ